MRTRTARSLLYLGGGLGLIISLFTAAEFYDESLTKACSFNGFFSCAAIAHSGKTSTLGIPDWAWGVGGFIVILALAALAERWPKDSRWAYLVLLVTSAGVAASLYFLYVELGEVGALCPVCASAYVMGVVAWVGAIGLAQRAYRRGHRATENAASAG